MNKFAEYLKTLIYVDGPQLALLGAGKTKLLALQVPELSEDQFFCVTLKQEEEVEYFSNKSDLFCVFFEIKNAMHYIATGSEDGRYRLTACTGEIPESYKPGRGIFASDHTSDYNPVVVSQDARSFALDGSWELQEFGRFQQLLAEVYSFCGSILEVGRGRVDAQVSDVFKRALNSVPYEGGGSYLSLFRSVKSSLVESKALRLVSIKKASPGEMVLAGNEDYFSETQKHIIRYLHNSADVEAAYAALYGSLKARGLLKVNVDSYVSDEAQTLEMNNLTERLLDAHDFSEARELLDYCNGNSLKFAKVVLSFHRRVSGAALYFRQGRVRFTSQSASSSPPAAPSSPSR